MSVQQEDKNKKRSKFSKEFETLFYECPSCIIQKLSYIDIIKPLIWKDLIRNGGKHGIRSVAHKYGLSMSKIRTIIKQLEKNG